MTATFNVAATPGKTGAPIKRGEDPRLLIGAGAFVSDLEVPGAVQLVFVRSPHGHARIRTIDVSAASRAPGVVRVLTAEDVQGAFAVPLANDVSARFTHTQAPQRQILAREKVRFVGEPIMVIAAESVPEALDAVDLVRVEYEPLDSVVDPAKALEPGAPILFEESGTNLAHRLLRQGGDVDGAFTRAERHVHLRIDNQRLAPTPMEPRGAAAQYAPATGELTIWSSTQTPHTLRTQLAEVLGLAENHLRVIAPDVGGGFGAKLEVSTEEVLTGWLAIQLRRPVRWVEGRSENFQSMVHGRGQLDEVDIAANNDGEILGLSVKVIADLGGALQSNTTGIAVLTADVLPGPYRVPAIRFELEGVYTNKTPVGAYRGAGRPEATFLLERVIDTLASELHLDPAEVRRRNFIAPDQFPYRTPMGKTYDSGEYARALDLLLQIADYDALRREQAAALADPSRPLIGIGISAYLEICGFGPWESATVRVEPSGKVTVLSGTSPHGQGHMTTFSQLVADQLALPLSDIVVRFGDTAVVPTGVGTFGSRSAAVGGSAVYGAALRVREKVLRIAAARLEVGIEDLQLEDGVISVRGVPEKAMTLAAVAKRAYDGKVPAGDEPGLEGTHFFAPPDPTFPFGMHLAVVEVDRETGRPQLRRYVAVDDCGRVLNPLILDGQRHGGIAQGVGQALFERVVYDEQGQLVTSTLGDYALPRAKDFPMLELDRTVTPTHVNPLGVKGIGEAGTVGSTPAVANAVVDALRSFHVRTIDMPCTAERIWRHLTAVD